MGDSRKQSTKPRLLTSGSLFRLLVKPPKTPSDGQTFRLVADAGLEACLEEGLTVVFFVAALEVVLFLSGVFFAFEAGVFEAGFFPVTSCYYVGNVDTNTAINASIPSWQSLVEKTQ